MYMYIIHVQYVMLIPVPVLSTRPEGVRWVADLTPSGAPRLGDISTVCTVYVQCTCTVYVQYICTVYVQYTCTVYTSTSKRLGDRIHICLSIYLYTHIRLLHQSVSIGSSPAHDVCVCACVSTLAHGLHRSLSHDVCVCARARACHH
jgi:hypothetical protein